jgi:hypothetical protein
MDEHKKQSIDYYRVEKRTAAQNLYQWSFAIIALCSAILGYTATKILGSSNQRILFFGSISAIIFSVTIIISLWRMFSKFRNDYLAASCGDKLTRGMNITDEEKQAENTYRGKTPYGIVKLTLWLFCLGILLMLIAVLPLSNLSSKNKVPKTVSITPTQ